MWYNRPQQPKEQYTVEERELSHTLHSNNISPPLFFSTSFTLWCRNKGRDAPDGFIDTSGVEIQFLCSDCHRIDNSFSPSCVFLWANKSCSEFWVTRIPLASMTSTCDRIISSPGMRPVAPTSRETEGFLEFFLEIMGCCHQTGVLFWWSLLFLGCASLQKGDAQEDAVKVEISPVSLLTGGWTVSMGLVIVMRDV